MDKKQAIARIRNWAQSHVDAVDRDTFREIAEDELLGLHEGNFARYMQCFDIASLKTARDRPWRQKLGAGEGNRTLVVSLGSFCSTIELHPRRATSPKAVITSPCHM